jgi:hypothetical protein
MLSLLLPMAVTCELCMPARQAISRDSSTICHEACCLTHDVDMMHMVHHA